MPEALEVELARLASDGLVGRTFVGVEATDALVVGDGVDEAVPGATVEAIGRRGKLLVVHTDGPTLGIHFGMTGRLLRDGDEPIGRLADDQRLVYGPGSDLPVWDRWAVRLDDGSRLRLQDPRRLGRVWLEPDVERLGPDALTLRKVDLAAALAGRRAPLKAVLLDQTAIAGLGNMLVDEVLWWSSIDPRRPAASLGADEVTALQHAIRRRLPVMLRRGGSHTGTLSPARRKPGGHCPRDGAELRRDVVGGRTTVWCPSHQR
jgi:formamidopyrimidine-DNA glycosylase